MDEKDIDPASASQESISRSPGTSQQTKTDKESSGKNDAKDGSESPARCPICLAPPQNDAKSDSCSHNFCFSCLKEWCKVKAECPLCKMPIHSIFYNIKSDSVYDEYKIKVPKPNLKYHSMFTIPDFSFNWWQSTLRREYFRRQRETNVAAGPANDVGSIRRRRMYYWNKSMVIRVDTRNRVRECSANFFRDNPTQVHRLVPWLRRELSVLYGARNKNLIDHLFKKIMDVLPHIDISSRQFKLMIQEYMLEYTDHFIHEFLSFARSPYDVSQYDQAADYGTNTDRMSRQSSRKHRSRQYRTGGTSRWDNSPDNLPLGASAQSMMLSQTSWSDEQPHNPLQSALQRLSSLCDPVSYRLHLMRDMSGIVDAPLQQQTMDLYRRGGSSARQYQSMERMRRHIGNYQMAVSNLRKKQTEYMSNSEMPAQSRIPTIVISDSSEDENVAAATSGRNVGNTIHYKPTTGQTKVNETRHGRIKVKKETSRRRSFSSSSSTTDTSDSDDGSSSSGIEFVRYIKPPHLRTPDAYIDLSSTDDDTPGPSSRLTAVIKPTISARSNTCVSLPDSGERNSKIALEKTKETSQDQLRISCAAVCPNSTSTSENIPTLPPNTSAEVTGEMIDQQDDNVASPSVSINIDNGNDSEVSRDAIPNQKDSTPKKIFEKGKVSINFPLSKRPYSSSDSESDVGYIEVLLSPTETSLKDKIITSDFHDNDVQQERTLKSVVSIPENQKSETSVPEALMGTRAHHDENTHHCVSDSNSDKRRPSNESKRRERRKHRKRKRSRHGESNHDNKHSKRHKKHRKRHRASRSSSVEFVKESR